MSLRNILVIGGTRYFGKRLVGHLLAAGDHVAVLTRGQSPNPFGRRVESLHADRNDAAALRAAVHGRHFDVVYDQMVYTPTQAALIQSLLAGHAGRYVMTSTLEVYDTQPAAAAPFTEAGLDLAEQPVHPEWAWQQDGFIDAHYGEGKRQAEAVLLQQSALPVVTVRCAHVLGAVDDFTGRFDFHVRRIAQHAPIAVPAHAQPTSFISADEIGRFLFWVGGESFLGPINAASTGALTAAELCLQIGAALQIRPNLVTQESAEAPLSPFVTTRPHYMSNARAHDLGFRFTDIAAWLPSMAREAHMALTRADSQRLV